MSRQAKGMTKREIIEAVWEDAQMGCIEEAMSMEVADMDVIRTIIHDDDAPMDVDGIIDDMDDMQTWMWFVDQISMLEDTVGDIRDWMTDDMYRE